MSETIFEKIVKREIPATIVAEGERWLAFQDIQPQAPVHVLIIPKRCIPRIGEAVVEEQDLLGELLLAAGLVARQVGVEKSGYRLVINHGKDGGEAVPHLHIHLLAGRAMSWPPG